MPGVSWSWVSITITSSPGISVIVQLFGMASLRWLLHFAEQLRTGSGRVLGRWMWDDALTRSLGHATASPEGGFSSSLGVRPGRQPGSRSGLAVLNRSSMRRCLRTRSGAGLEH